MMMMHVYKKIPIYISALILLCPMFNKALSAQQEISYKPAEGLVLQIDDLNSPDSGELAIAFSPDDRLLAANFRNPKTGYQELIQIWDIAERKMIDSFNVPETINSIVFNSDNKIIAVGASSTIYLYDLGKKSIIRKLSCGDQLIWKVVFSQEGQRIASICAGGKAGGREGKITIWEVSSGRKIQTLRNYIHWGTDEIENDGIKFCLGGNQIIVASGDDAIIKYDVNTGKILHKEYVFKDRNEFSFNLIALYNDCGSFVFSISEETNEKYRLKSTDMEKLVFIGSIDLTEELMQLSGHYDFISSLSLNGNGSMLASTSFDGSLKIWDSTKGKLLFEHVPDEFNYPSRVLLSRNKWVMTYHTRRINSIKIWNLEKISH